MVSTVDENEKGFPSNGVRCFLFWKLRHQYVLTVFLVRAFDAVSVLETSRKQSNEKQKKGLLTSC